MIAAIDAARRRITGAANSGLPVAIGGIGGSGTRVVAALVRSLGYYLGDDVNEAGDNLWFTLLFKYRSVLAESDAGFRQLVSMFIRRMSGAATLSASERQRIVQLVERPRLQHPREWLAERAASFADGKTSKRPGQPWGWKEPNTHVVLDRLLALHDALRYLHVYRHPLDMALSGNQNQLENWGPIFLDRDVAIAPREALSYWCAAHRRMTQCAADWPGRTLTVELEALCRTPDRGCREIAQFLGVEPSGEALSAFRRQLRLPDSVGRYKTLPLEGFAADDLAYVASLGFPLD